MKKNVFDHFGLKILSLVIAVIIWIVVANIDDYKMTKQILGIEIEFVNGEAITGKNKVYEVPEGTTIDVVVKGRRKVVEGLTKEDFKAVADLSKMSITNAVKVEVSAVRSQVARDLTISYTNDSVVVAVENKVSQQLPITVRTNGNVADGYAIRSKTAAPNLITVEGAESVVNMINEVVVDINVSGARDNLTTTNAPIFLDKGGTAIDPSKFAFDQKNIEVTVDVLKTKELNIKMETVGEPKEGNMVSAIDYQPTSILVVGDDADLAKVDEIRIDDIDVTGCEEDMETSVSIADYLPEGILLADEMEEIMIKVMIEPIVQKTLIMNESDINIVGKSTQYTYSYTDNKSYPVTLKGLQEQLDRMKVSSLIPSIDVSGYGAGRYTFTVSMKEFNKVSILDTIEVELEITPVE